MKPSLLLLLPPLLLFSACAAPLQPVSTDPQTPAAYVLVTAAPQASLTPFQPGSAPSPQPPTLAPLPALPTPTLPIPTLAPAPLQRTQYALSAHMDYANHTVQVNEEILYPNLTGEPLPDLLLAVNPNLWNGVFNLQNLRLNDLPWQNYSLQSHALQVNLPTPLPPQQTVKIGIAYTLTLPYSAAKVENFGYTYRQTNLIDWYPFIVPRQNGGWVLNPPHAYGENLVYPLADFRLRLTYADAAPPVTAAAALPRQEENALVYEHLNARNLTLSASPYFALLQTEAGGIPIQQYYFAEDAAAAAHVLEMTRLALLTYANAYGAYPRPNLTIVETDLSDGLEADGLYFLAADFYQAFDGTVRNNLTTIAVHETAHQWWYGAVANDQARQPWLDESLCTYSERIFYETNYPGALSWWWNFRIYYHNPSGYVDWQIYDTESFRPYVNAAYFQGAKFLESLRTRTGDAAFFAFLQAYYAQNKGQIATTQNFFSALRQNTQAEYADLLATYFLGQP